jgi:hypothetical protein
VLVLALLVSLVGLGLGPALLALGQARRAVSEALDGFALGLVPAVLLVRLLPHVVAGAGLLAVLCVAAGFLALVAADRHHHGGNRAGAVIVVPALVVHALTDGAGLAVATSSAREVPAAGLLLALVTHRLPEGLFLATTLVPLVGWAGALRRIALVGAATVVGAALGGALLERIPDAFIDVVVALGLGAMLRLALHSHTPRPLNLAGRAASGASFVLGIAAALALPAPDSVFQRASGPELPMVRSLLPFCLETAPAMLAALLLEALRAAALGAPSPREGERPGAGAQLAVGVRAALGRALSPDERLAEIEQRLKAGAPVAAVVSAALLCAGPDLAALVLALRLLGPPMALALAAGAWSVAAFAALVSRAVAATEPLRRSQRNARVRLRLPRPTENCRGPAATAAARVLHAAEVLGPSYLAGLLAASALEALLPPGVLGPLASARWTLPASLVGLLLLVDLRAAIPVVAVLVHKGLAPSAAMALLTVGGGTCLGLSRALARTRGERTGGATLLAAVTGSVLVGLAAGTLLPGASLPEVHGLLAHRHLIVEWIALVVLGALLVLGVLRAGPRTWLAAARTMD